MVAAPAIVILCLVNARRIGHTTIGGSVIDAAAAGDVKLLAKHVAAHDSLNEHDEAGRTPLSAAVNYPDAMKYLLEHGAYPDVPAEGGDLPIMLVCGTGNDAALDLLLAHGAKTDVRDAQGSTPLIVAISNNNVSTAIDLIKHGANVNATNQIGATASHYAAALDEVEVLKALLEAKANFSTRTQIGVTPFGRAILSARKGAAEFLWNHGGRVIDPEFSAMHYAALAGALPIQLKYIVEPRMDHSNGKLVEGTRQGYANVNPAVMARTAELIPFLAKVGLDVNARGKNGFTPLHMAAMSDNASAATALLKAGADPNLMDAQGLTPLQLAVNGKCGLVLPVLRQARK